MCETSTDAFDSIPIAVSSFHFIHSQQQPQFLSSISINSFRIYLFPRSVSATVFISHLDKLILHLFPWSLTATVFIPNLINSFHICLFPRSVAATVFIAHLYKLVSHLFISTVSSSYSFPQKNEITSEIAAATLTQYIVPIMT